MTLTSTNADPVALATRLMACPSVTPARGEVFAELEAMLEPLGFTVDRFVSGEAPDGPVENLLAHRTTGPGPQARMMRVPDGVCLTAFSIRFRSIFSTSAGIAVTGGVPSSTNSSDLSWSKTNGAIASATVAPICDRLVRW